MLINTDGWHEIISLVRRFCGLESTPWGRCELSGQLKWLGKAHNATMTWQHLCYKLRLLKICPQATHYTISSGHFLLKPLIKFEWLQKYRRVNSYMTASYNHIMPKGMWLFVFNLFIFSACSQLPGIIVGPHNTDIYCCLYPPLLFLCFSVSFEWVYESDNPNMYR